MALILNHNDQVGRMNEIVGRTRELVFVDRQNEIKGASPEFTEFRALSQQLINESISSAIFVEQSRKKLAASIGEDIKQNLTKQMRSGQIQSPASSQGLHFESAFDTVELGFNKNGISNVEESKPLEALHSFDKDNSYLCDAEKFYRAELNVKLPAPDDQLTFYVSSLTAPVDGAIFPARLFEPQAFKSSFTLMKQGDILLASPDRLPSALHLRRRVNLNANGLHVCAIVGTVASTTGANRP